MATPDQVRTAILRLLSARDAEAAAKASLDLAVRAHNTAQVEATSAARDLASITGDAAFSCAGKLVRVVTPLGSNCTSLTATVTVQALADVTLLDPIAAMPAAPVAGAAEVAATPVGTAAKPGPPPHVRPGEPYRLSGGKFPETVKGKK